MQGVYLLHYERQLGRAQHYLGASRDMFKRIDNHRKGNGARMPAAFARAGIEFELARIWIAMEGENPFYFERRIKQRHNSRQWCPICQGDLAHRELMATYERRWRIDHAFDLTKAD